MFDWIGNALGGFFTWLGDVFNWFFSGITAVFTWIVEAINTVLTFIGSIISLIIQFFEMVITFILDFVNVMIAVIEIVFMIIQVVIGLIGIVLAYIGQGISLFFQIIAGINGAKITAIPGMPRCVSAPLESQICSIWYVLDYTLLADGTPGAYIIPIVVLLVDLAIAFFVIKYIFALINDVQSLFLVG